MKMKECKLPDIEDSKTTSGEQIKRFREDGHTIIKAIIVACRNGDLSFNN